jgi:hypothetical protein
MIIKATTAKDKYVLWMKFTFGFFQFACSQPAATSLDDSSTIIITQTTDAVAENKAIIPETDTNAATADIANADINVIRAEISFDISRTKYCYVVYL